MIRAHRSPRPPRHRCKPIRRARLDRLPRHVAILESVRLFSHRSRRYFVHHGYGSRTIRAERRRLRTLDDR